MNRIIHKEQLSADVFLMRLEAPLIAAERQAGQFIILQLDNSFAERIPLTIATADLAEGSGHCGHSALIGLIARRR